MIEKNTSVDITKNIIKTLNFAERIISVEKIMMPKSRRKMAKVRYVFNGKICTSVISSRNDFIE